MDRAFELGMRGLGLGRDRDIGAVAGGAQRDREPDAPRSAGDEEGLAFERHRRHRLRAKNASKAASGIRPRLTNGVEKYASEPATTKSQWNSMVVPTPTATPLTAATIGLLQRTSAGRKRSAGRLRPPELSTALRKSARSLPAENAPGTPAISTQRTESSAFAPSSAAVIASYMPSVSAFFLSGRFIRMVRMPSASVTITCSVIKCIRFPLHRPQPGSRSRSWLDRWAAKNRGRQPSRVGFHLPV